MGVALAAVQASAQVPSDVLQQRVADLKKQSRDTVIQIEALEQLIEGTPGKLGQLDEYADQLDAMRDDLAAINQNNLIKLLLRLSYEVYNTVDSTASGGKAVVESFVNIGIHYTMGRLAFENAGAAGQKALGLDSANYLGPRCASVRRMSEEAVAQAAAIGKVHIALNRDLNYYRALVQAEQGSDPGETGAILKKNVVVREHIGMAIAALNTMKGTAVSQVQQAESDLEWLLEESASISALLAAVELQLAEALAAEKEAWLSAAQTNLLAQVVQPDPPSFDFSYPAPEPGDTDYHHNYHTARYVAGAQRVTEILAPLISPLESLYTQYETKYADVMTNQAALIAWVQDTTRLWEERVQLAPDDFRSLGETFYDIRDTTQLLDELVEKRVAFAAAAAQLARIEPLLAEFNNLKAKTRGCDTIATESAYLVSEYVPAGQTPRPILGMFSWERLRAIQGLPPELPWGSESFTTLAKPLGFELYFETLADFEAWEPRIERAIENLTRARDAYREHLAGLRSAVSAELQRERSHQELLDLHTSRLVHSLQAAEDLAAQHPFCGHSDVTFYLGVHNTFFNIVRLSEALAAALRDHTNAAPARALWNRYLDFIPKYQAIDRQYREAVYDTLRVVSSRTPAISALRAELDAAVGAAEIVGETPPEGQAATALEIEGAYYDALHQAREIRSHQDARVLPECAIADPLPEPIITAKPHLDDPLARLVPVYGLLLIHETMDTEFKRLMDMTSRDEAAMWEVTYAIAGQVNEWKTGHTSVPLAYSFHSVADLMKGSRLYDTRMAWEAAFAAPSIVSQPVYVAIPPGGSQPITVQVSSHKAFTCNWYRDEWFGDDELVGSGTTLTLPAPTGLEQYYCVAINQFGTARGARIDVFPAAPPRFAQQPEGAQVPLGSPAQLVVQLYLTTSAHVEQTGTWFVSVTDDQAAGFIAIPRSAETTLRLSSVTADRWYYYEATNPWGTTRSTAVKISAVNSSGPAVLTPAAVSVFVGVPFRHQLDAVNCDAFQLVGNLPVSWLAFDSETGLFSGTPLGTAPASVSCQVRAVQVQPGKTNYSAPVTVAFSVRPQSEWPGPRGLRYFTPVENLDPAIGGANADSDKDGIPNAWEYLLGTSPTQPDPQESKPRFHVQDGRVIVSWQRVKARADLSYRVESSRDLIEWKPVVSLAGTVVETGPDAEWVSYQVQGTNQAFLRLKADVAR